MVKTLIIDNYDSYTFNLYQLIAKINGSLPIVIRNDQLNYQQLLELNFDNIVISPGPGRPENPDDFGIGRFVLEDPTCPLLGVCLGHQGIGHFYGGKVIHAPEVYHGRTSPIYHQGVDLFQNIPNPFSVVRYHSLLVDENLPDCLEKTAWTVEGLVMGLRHRELPIWGVQFHPESICTEYGRLILENFRTLTLQWMLNQPFQQSFETKKSENYCHSSIPLPPPQEQHSELQLSIETLNFCPDSEQLFFHLFSQSHHAFWLDSSRLETGLSRFSFMGDGSGEHSFLVHYYSQNQALILTRNDKIVHQNESIFEYLKQEITRRSLSSKNLPFDFNGGFVGYFGYELKGECGAEFRHSSPLPDAMFLFADRLIALDHQTQTLYLLCLTDPAETFKAKAWFKVIESQIKNLPPLPDISQPEMKDFNLSKPIIFRWNRSPQTYIKDIQKSLHEIREGETYQVCLTNQIKTETTPNPLNLYRTLRRINPAPYSAFLRFNDLAIACSSPERFLKIDPQGWVETKPIKGTFPRGKTPAEDEILCEQLRTSEKNRAENLMIVDLLRNDLGQVCEVGTVEVSKLMDVETYATVHQLVTTIRGYLASNLQALDCIRAAFPGGSMTGAPKLRTLEIIDRLEQEARGIYSGAIGFLGLNGAVDLNIVIRTIVLTPEETSLGVGGGIVALSEPELEYQEMCLKAQALIQAIVLTTHGTFEPHYYQFLTEEPAKS